MKCTLVPFYLYTKFSLYLFAFMSLIGFLTPIATKLCVLAAFIFLAPWQNYGFYHHFSNVFLINALIMSFSTCGHSFSIDSIIAKKYPRYPFRSRHTFVGEYTWPLQLLKFFWCYIFFSAIVLKLVSSGSNWLSANILGELLIHADNYYVLYKERGFQFSRLLRKVIVEHYWLGRLGTLAVVSLEAIMPLILFYKASVKFLVPAGVLMFIIVYITMGHLFIFSTMPLVLAILFLEINFGKISYSQHSPVLNTH
jgi:hypothetical protein